MTKLIVRLILPALACTVVQAKDVKWDDLCSHGKHRALTITTASSGTIRGRCLQQNDREIVIKDGHFRSAISRSDIVTVRQDRISSISVKVPLIAGGGLVVAGAIAAHSELVGATAALILFGTVAVWTCFEVAHLIAGSRELTII